MTDIRNLRFKRLFALNMYKDKKLLLAKMSFDKDFINDKRGDMYPTAESAGVFAESVENGKYTFASCEDGAYTSRLLCRHFPYASYSIKASGLDGECGIMLKGENASGAILFSSENGKIKITNRREVFFTDISLENVHEFTVTCRREKFDIYIKSDSGYKYIKTFELPEFWNISKENVFFGTTAYLYVSGKVCVTMAESRLDCGISQADIRPIRYENGETMTEQGRIYLTASIRMQEECYQGIFSWIPGTCEFEMTGALFFDVGDRVWSNDVATSMIYHRGERKWLLWVCSFSHGHILGSARFDGDVRFGINVIDITLMERMTNDDPDTAFLGKEGDEDPDFIYDEEKKKWYMIICRTVTDESGKRNYRYFLFESNRPFKGYKYLASSKSGSETGGSILKIDGRYYLTCGNSFTERANYRCYSLPDMEDFSLMTHDYDDGGFRGWGTVIPVKKGSRTVYYHLTFDRHRGSSYNWSYGNIYCFIAE